MSAGDLGLDPRHVESKLQGILDMCTRWNAILLLDEADVFLEERSLHELERNKLVSIFLRVLEYYEGIMFLTTNRVQTFDQAFQSRIHISLDYKELDAPSRKRVWTNFLDQHNIAQAAARERPPKPTTSAAKSNETAAKGKASRTEEEEEARKQAHLKRTEPHAMSEKDITKLARLQMNGRQIKNILKAAQMLATRKEEGLSYQHVEMVMVSICSARSLHGDRVCCHYRHCYHCITSYTFETQLTIRCIGCDPAPPPDDAGDGEDASKLLLLSTIWDAALACLVRGSWEHCLGEWAPLADCGWRVR
jgi:hypothetical protein